jgi:ABC-type glycerol-3-phosphate transport system substrate-binding protein
MQQVVTAKPRRRARIYRSRLGGGAVVGVVMLGVVGALLPVGCGGGPDETPKEAGKAYAGVTLRVSCPDAKLAGVLGPMAKVWAARTGAAVEVVTAPMTPGDAADVGVVPFADLGTWGDRGELVPVPAALKDAGHPYQWAAVFPAYRGEPFAGWGRQLYGLPLAADGYVLVYRADRFADEPTRAAFQKQFNKPLAAPAAWDDFAAVAGFFAGRDKQPSLPPLPADPGQLVGLFSRVAACYDRAALGDAAGATGAAGPAGVEALAFQFRLEDGRPRLDAASFGAAAGWLAELKAKGCLPAGGPADAVAALAEGRAVLGVLSLGELARLGAGGGRYAVAALPGARAVIDPKTGALVPTGVNYVPHLAGGWLGVVRARCPKPEAAVDLLAELGGPARGLEVVAATGYGPVRDTHLDRDRLLAWLGYGFDDARSKALQDALRSYVGKEVRNPTYGLRGPDHAALTAALADELRRVAAGEVPPEEGLKRATAAWEKVTAGTPADKLREWRRRAAGLE